MFIKHILQFLSIKFKNFNILQSKYLFTKYSLLSYSINIIFMMIKYFFNYQVFFALKKNVKVFRLEYYFSKTFQDT